MSNSKKCRVWEILFAIFSIGLIGLIVYSFVKNGMSTFVDGWSKLNVIHNNLLFEVSVASMFEIVISLLSSIIMLVCAIAIIFKAKSRKTLMKPVTISIFLTKIIAGVLFIMKANIYLKSVVITDNMVFWTAMLFIAVFDLVVSGLMIFLAYDKKIFVPATTMFSVILIVIMSAEIVNTHLYKFFEVPLFPDMSIGQGAELLNEGSANMACYINLCIAFMGVWLARYSANIEERVIRRTIVGQNESDTDDIFAIPKKIIVSEAEPAAEKEVTATDNTEFLPEIDTDDNMKIDLGVDEKTGVEAESEVIPESEVDIESQINVVPEVEIDEKLPVDPKLAQVIDEVLDADAVSVVEGLPKVGEEEETIIEEVTEEIGVNITAQNAASELINLTMRLQKKEITEDEYDWMKKDLFDNLL